MQLGVGGRIFDERQHKTMIESFPDDLTPGIMSIKKEPSLSPTNPDT